MNRYQIDPTELAGYTRKRVRIPERAHTARMIVVPERVIIINEAAAPGCNVDRAFFFIWDYMDFMGDRAAEILRG